MINLYVYIYWWIINLLNDFYLNKKEKYIYKNWNKKIKNNKNK